MVSSFKRHGMAAALAVGCYLLTGCIIASFKVSTSLSPFPTLSFEVTTGASESTDTEPATAPATGPAADQPH